MWLNVGHNSAYDKANALMWNIKLFSAIFKGI